MSYIGEWSEKAYSYITNPAYRLIKSEASARMRESRVPVTTNASPSRQLGGPSGGGGFFPRMGGMASTRGPALRKEVNMCECVCVTDGEHDRIVLAKQFK